MALIQPSISINTIVGSAGSNTFSRNRGGNYVKIRKTSTNPRTSYQQAIRTLFASMTETWRTLSDSQRTVWRDRASLFPYQNKFGDTKYYSGQQLFNKLNSNLNAIGQSILTDCPLPYSFNTLNEFYFDTDDHSHLEIEIAVSGADSNAKIELWGSPSVSAGVKYFSPSTYKLIAVLDYTNYSNYRIESFFASRSLPLTVGQRVGLKIVPISLISGQASTPLFATTILT